MIRLATITVMTVRLVTTPAQAIHVQSATVPAMITMLHLPR